MQIIRKSAWALADRLVTPEQVFMNRRQLLVGAGFLGIGAGLGLGLNPARATDSARSSPYPAPRNPAFADAGRPVTPEALNTTYNNFYEFSTNKRIFELAEQLKTRPWDIAIDGEVEKPFTIGFDDLLAKVKLEERVYRHRCVEAWSMVVPWTGFPLKDLVALAKPLSSAKYVRMETFVNPEMAPGQQPSFLAGTMPWPYVEGVTMAEAANDLAFMVTGAYGKPVAKSMGAPIRLHLPWKYGFKSIKSIVKVSFVKERPVGFWEQLQGSEYGFWANVNPQVPHPRWSQATERVLGTDERIPTQLYNGYGAQVASLYSGLDGEKLWM
jgi:methionine sulfoxide reductase catalytic subunit